MEVTKTLEPGDRATARLVRRCGDRLACVRYRLDSARKKGFTTVERIVDERDAPEGYRPLTPRPPAQKQLVLVRVDFDETELRLRVKEAHRRSDPERRGWILPFATVNGLGLEDRIIKEHVPRSGHTTGDRP